MQQQLAQKWTVMVYWNNKSNDGKRALITIKINNQARYTGNSNGDDRNRSTVYAFESLKFWNIYFFCLDCTSVYIIWFLSSRYFLAPVSVLEFLYFLLSLNSPRILFDIHGFLAFASDALSISSAAWIIDVSTWSHSSSRLPVNSLWSFIFSFIILSNFSFVSFSFGLICLPYFLFLQFFKFQVAIHHN